MRNRGNEFCIRFFWCMLTLAFVLFGDGLYRRDGDEIASGVILMLLSAVFVLAAELWYD